MKYSVRTIFLIFICLYAFFGAFNYAGAILSNPLSCFGPGTDFDATKAEANYYDPDPAPKINQFFVLSLTVAIKMGILILTCRALIIPAKKDLIKVPLTI